MSRAQMNANKRRGAAQMHSTPSFTYSFSFQSAFIPFAPCPHGIQNRFQAIPQFRQRIFHPGRHFSVNLPGQQPAFLHLPLELLKNADPEVKAQLRLALLT